MFRSPSLQSHETQRSADALPMHYSGSDTSRRSTDSGSPTDFYPPSPRDGSQTQRASDAGGLSINERYPSKTRAGHYTPEVPPLPFIPPDDISLRTTFARPLSDPDLTPAKLDLASSLERSRIDDSRTQSLGPGLPHVSRAPTTYARSTPALSPVPEQSTDMMSNSRGLVHYAPPTTVSPVAHQPQPYQQGFDASGRPILYRNCVPIVTTAAPDMFRDMHSASEVLSREGIDRIDRDLDGSFYAFSRSFPRGTDVTALWRQLYGAMMRASLLPHQGEDPSPIVMPKNASTNRGRAGGMIGIIIVTVINFTWIWLFR
ncbi:uncharacterized protein BT62DRAFT_924541 [Guyanagaster necrorhizus]|uniref:Uncharacterized protein n=1 Tax=Guyanagaster necrorhizus TaxID=856835 RepID=A0A9P7VFF5_9AGAR|nr:uncharacterized protein BT62DRAFT_924541 [Guyanagaster necrorhizus MCA 3950]KAG7439719.1 hypothetical protein BT62DRAFT_924541 [Guyanagaster necrorhizus MCA 3950]